MGDGGRASVGVLYVVVAAPPRVRAPADLADLPPVADLVELRLDLLLAQPDVASVPAWVAAAPRPVIATVRSRAQGGAFDGGAAAAAALLEAAAAAGAAWIDAEAEVLPRLGPRARSRRVVASAHGAEGTGAGGIADARGADLVKLARPVEDAAGWARLRAEASATARAGAGRTFVVPYGALGATRGAFVASGGPGFLYGSASEASAVVGGQPPLEVLLDTLRVGEVGPDAELFGLLGEPPSRSPSPALHNAVFRAETRAALYVPLPGLDLESARALPFAGLSVTHPYKVEAARAADVLGADARATGAVNTLVSEADGTRWRGENTDVAALRALLPAAAEGARAFVYGAGGFARAAVHVLREHGYGVRVGGIDAAQGRALAAAAGVPFAGERYERGPADTLLVNATPAGARGEDPAGWGAADVAGLLVVDAPYAAGARPAALAEHAARSGAVRTIDGTALLVEQAYHQARLFGARSRDEAALRRVLALAVRPPANLVLLGGRGSGKTSVGRAVARALGRPFVDLDDEVTRRTGRTPAAWIRTDGWDAFRVEEGLALQGAAARRGIVLATGGGTVERAECRTLLARAGVLVYLEVTPACAAARIGPEEGARPRWPGCVDALDEARTLLARRAPLWKALARHVVDGTRGAERVAADVADCWVGDQARRPADGAARPDGRA